jgi:FHA domain
MRWAGEEFGGETWNEGRFLMVKLNTGGISTMLGQWRVVLKQAEESARSGHYDEALALASRADVADHRQAVQLRGRLAKELVARAQRRAEADDLTGAIEDLDLAEKHGEPPDVLAAARLKLAEHVTPDLRTALEAGDPARVTERIDELARKKIGGPILRRFREAAETWQAALVEARRGEFGLAIEHLDRADRLVPETVRPALGSTRRDLESKQQATHSKVEQLYRLLSDAPDRWTELLMAAESVLEVVPDHPAARQARTNAWQHLGAISPTATLPPRTPQRPSEIASPEIRFIDDDEAQVSAPPVAQPGIRTRAGMASGPSGRSLLWADAVGGFLVCHDDQIVIGRAGPDSVADIPILGDLSRRHATIARTGENYLLRAHAPTYANGRPVDTVTLRDGDVIRLGASVELEFRQPSPVSSTARLQLLSRHRLPMAVDGVILMAQTCIIGPTRQSHILAPRLKNPVVLFRQANALWCRAIGAFEVDGRPCLARAALAPRASVVGEGFSFSVEPLPPRVDRGERIA